jgi:hypothetical protein
MENSIKSCLPTHVRENVMVSRKRLERLKVHSMVRIPRVSMENVASYHREEIAHKVNQHLAIGHRNQFCEPAILDLSIRIHLVQ